MRCGDSISMYRHIQVKAKERSRCDASLVGRINKGRLTIHANMSHITCTLHTLQLLNSRCNNSLGSTVNMDVTDRRRRSRRANK